LFLELAAERPPVYINFDEQEAAQRLFRWLHLLLAVFELAAE
jgi:hypothetical protein